MDLAETYENENEHGNEHENENENENQYARRGQILFTRLRHRKIATRSLYRWHIMLYNSYGASSPEPFQKLGQSLKVSRRVDNS